MGFDVNEKLLEAVREIARSAGAAIIDVYNSDFAVQLKDDRSPLTAADRVAHELIVTRLGRLHPHFPVLSEEASDIDFSIRGDWQRYWLVDPLDGTKEFIKRNGEFTVNIALIDSGKPVLGVVFAPALNLEYCSSTQNGAFKREGNGALHRIRVACPPSAPLRVVGSRSHAGDALAGYLDALGPHILKPMGSSLKICLVAEGSADIYPRLGPTSEWDTAAAQAILEHAGGSMIDTVGRPLAYNTKEDLLNPYFLAIGDNTRDWLAPIRKN